MQGQPSGERKAQNHSKLSSLRVLYTSSYRPAESRWGVGLGQNGAGGGLLLWGEAVLASVFVVMQEVSKSDLCF